MPNTLMQYSPGTGLAGQAAITRLFCLAAPSTVLGRVRAVVVNSINRMGWRRPWPHVCVEGGEIILPLFADGNSPSSILGEFGVARIKAALLHRSPTVVFRHLPHPMGQVRLVAPSPFSEEAPTGTGASASADNGFGSTVTHDLPVPRPLGARHSMVGFYKYELAKAFASTVSHLRTMLIVHGPIIAAPTFTCAEME